MMPLLCGLAKNMPMSSTTWVMHFIVWTHAMIAQIDLSCGIVYRAVWYVVWTALDEDANDLF